MKKIIMIQTTAVNDLDSKSVFVEAVVEREREKGAPFNTREYGWVTPASFRRIQRAQVKLLEDQAVV